MQHGPGPQAGQLKDQGLRALLRREVPHLEDDRYFHPDIAAATKLVSEGAVIGAAGAAALPGLEGLAR